jgi:hypothetical protein
MNYILKSALHTAFDQNLDKELIRAKAGVEPQDEELRRLSRKKERLLIQDS